ncbi:MAG: asparagine synthase-related protein, partial [Chitinivibrionales bacterium]
EGADEVFGGYNIFKEDKVRRFWARNPQSRLRPQLLRKLYPYITANGAAGNFWQMFFKRDLTAVDDPYYSHMIRWNNTSQLQRFFSPEMRQQLNPREHVYGELEQYLDADMHRWDPLCRAQYLEMTLFMSGYLLSSQGDRMMMGHSIEGRFPFLDHRVVEFASRIPPEYKLRHLNEKYILKKTFEDIVPMDVVNRSKQPYRAPITPCFTSKESGITASMLSEKALGESRFLDASGVRRLVEKCTTSGDRQASARDDMALAAIVSLQLLQFHFGEGKNTLRRQQLPDTLAAGLIA